MKISQLDLLAFGPFTGVTLDFSSHLPGLHVVYGPNEAGKSTALRGLLALLFGFSSRTTDSFLHPYNQLLVGGRFQGPDGSEIVIRRRKKIKNDLFDADDNPVSSEILYSFLRGMDQETFLRMHGIDHDRLIQGGQGILDQQGEVGQALFSAGAGFASIRTILSTLEREADALFRPRAFKTELGQSLGRYKELQHQLRQVILHSKDWKKHHQALTLAQTRYQDLTTKQRELARNIRALEQLQQALPYLAQRRDVQDKLEALGTVQALPEDFSRRRLELEERINVSKVKLDGLLARQETCQKRLAQLHPDWSILEQADLIEDLQLRLGEYRKAQLDRPRLEGQRISSKTEASRMLRLIRPELPLEQVETLRPVLLKRKAVQSLEQEYALAEQSWTQVQGQEREAAAEVDRLQKDLAGLKENDDFSALAQAVTQAHKAGDLDLLIRELQTELHQLKEQASSRLGGLGLWSGEISVLVGLAMPLDETIAGFESDLGLVEDQLKQLARENERLKDEEKTLLREARVLEQGHSVPEFDDLFKHRERRDQGWQLVQRAWLLNEDVDHEAHNFDPTRPLAEAYALSVGAADQFADTLYREAERVQKYAGLTAQLDLVGQEQESCSQKLQVLTQRKNEILSRWQLIWRKNNIDPLSPREMQAWLIKFEAVRALAEKIIRLEKEVQAQKEKRQEMIRLFQGCLSLPAQENLDFNTVLHQAETTLKGLDQARVARETLIEVVREKERFLTKCQFQKNEAKHAWQSINKRWQSTMTELGFPPTTKPGQTSDYIEALQKLFVALDEVNALKARQKGIDLDADNLKIRVHQLVEELELLEETQDLALLITRLKARLQQALREQALKEQQDHELLTLEKEILDLKARQKAEEEGLDQFLAQVGVYSVGESIEVEERWQRFQVLRTRADDLDATLASITHGGSTADLKALALTWSDQDLAGHLEMLRESRDQLEPEIQALAEEIGQEKNELSRMDGADTAARINEELEAELAKISRITQGYIQTMLAVFVLRQEVERFRQQHQNPLLAKASEVFQTLTLGSFSGLRVDLNESDQPVLLGVRLDEQRVPVEGMSSGTRDQLYLALRLAALIWQTELAGPMPFVVDDILINFDEQRAQATLRVLADLASKFQIIMFTHQGIIKDFAMNLGRSDRVFVHQL